MNYVWIALSSVGILLQLLLLHELTKDHYKKFPILSVYAVVLFLSTVVEAGAFYNPSIWARTSRYYWIIDSIRQVLIFTLVIGLTYRVMGDTAKRSSLRRGIVLGALLFTLLSVLLARDPRFGFWMARVGRNLGFCAVILNLILWAVLIKFRQEDRTLLLISGGLGIQMAGKAIGHSLRQFSTSVSSPVQIAGDLIIVLSHLVCLYIWWQTFRAFDRWQPQRYNDG